MHVFRRKMRKNVQILVEVTGLEPTTSWSRTKRATKLRYTSKKYGDDGGDKAAIVSLFIICISARNVKRIYRKRSKFYCAGVGASFCGILNDTLFTAYVPPHFSHRATVTQSSCIKPRLPSSANISPDEHSSHLFLYT